MQPACCPGWGRLLPGDVCNTRRGGCRSRPASERLAAGSAVGLCWAAVLLCRCCLRFCRRCFCLLVVSGLVVPRSASAAALPVALPLLLLLLFVSLSFVVVLSSSPLSCLSRLTSQRRDGVWLKTRERTLRAKECPKAGLRCRGVVGGRLLLPPLSTLFPTHHCGSTSRLEKTCTA